MKIGGLKSTDKYFYYLPYKMVVNCNTVLFEFGALNATHSIRWNLASFANAV